MEKILCLGSKWFADGFSLFTTMCVLLALSSLAISFCAGAQTARRAAMREQTAWYEVLARENEAVRAQIRSPLSEDDTCAPD